MVELTDEPKRYRYWANLAAALARSGDYERAARELRALVEQAGSQPEPLWCAASAYSLISAIAAADSKLSAGERSGRREAAAAAAVALLEKRRVAGGFADPEHIKGLETSTDLDPLRSRADFQRVLDKVEAHSHAPSP